MGAKEHLSLGRVIDLIEGIDQGQLYLDYQPVVDVISGRVHAVEALVRWAHPRLGLLAPDAFLPHAQASRLGSVVTAFVLRQACLQWTAWRDAGIRVRLAVNVPPGELVDETVPGLIAELAGLGFDASALTIEVTERRIDALVDLGPTLEAMRSQGVGLSIDDFGTGDSTLVRLQDLCFNEIKIDRCFTDGVTCDGTARKIIRFATELAHGLGMVVVAEGVEVAAQLASLRVLDVDLVQGYHLARPGTAQAVTALMLA